METKQHAIKSQWVNDEIKELKNTLGQMTMKIEPCKIYRMQQKQFIAIGPSPTNKKNLN